MNEDVVRQFGAAVDSLYEARNRYEVMVRERLCRRIMETVCAARPRWGDVAEKRILGARVSAMNRINKNEGVR